MLNNIPNEWGSKYQRDSAAIAYTHTGPNAIKYTAKHDSALILLTPQPGREIALNSDRPNIGLAPAGSLELFPISSDVSAEWKVSKQSILVTIDPYRLSQLAGNEFNRDHFEFHPPQLGTVDRFTHLLAQSMRYEIDNAALSFEECLDAFVTVLYTHLLRNYSSLKPYASNSINGGLSPASWRKVNDFIQAHIADTLSLETLASVAKLSPSHFARAFKQTTGQSPHYYVLTSRLTRASEHIRKTEIPLNEIALCSGFSSQSHMTSLMKRLWGTTPAEYRRHSRE